MFCRLFIRWTFTITTTTTTTMMGATATTTTTAAAAATMTTTTMVEGDYESRQTNLSNVYTLVVNFHFNCKCIWTFFGHSLKCTFHMYSNVIAIDRISFRLIVFSITVYGWMSGFKGLSSMATKRNAITNEKLHYFVHNKRQTLCYCFLRRFPYKQHLFQNFICLFKKIFFFLFVFSYYVCLSTSNRAQFSVGKQQQCKKKLKMSLQNGS